MTRRGDRRRATDNVDLSGDEHAWWAGNGNRRRPAGPPAGVPERRVPERRVPERRKETVTVGAPTESAAASPAPSAQAAPTPSGNWLTDDRPLDHDPWHRSTAPSVAEAYRVLGIDWEASWAEVTTEFRSLAACWHPDRLVNAEPAVQAEGQRRMSDYNRAYNDLRRILRPTSRRELFAD